MFDRYNIVSLKDVQRTAKTMDNGSSQGGRKRAHSRTSLSSELSVLPNWVNARGGPHS